MTDNFRQFTLEIDDFTEDELPRVIQQVTQKIALQGLTGLVMKTPVDLGGARANWQVTIGEPADGEIDDTDPSGQPTIAKGTTVTLTVPPFGVVWITNNLPYIEALENGHSQQAPQGMLGTTLTELESQFQRVDE